MTTFRVLLSRILGAMRRWIEEGARTGGRRLELHLGGPQRTQVIVLLAAVLALSSADTATVGASATQLRSALHIDNTDIGLLVAVNAGVAAVFSIPFGFVADRFRRTHVLSGSVFLWGGAMLWSATAGSFGKLLLARLTLGVVTAAAGPVVASLIGDYFPSTERGRIYGYVLTGELIGAGFGFAISGDIAALSWRLAFVILAIPTFVLARLLLRLPEPIRGGLAPLHPQEAGPGRAATRRGDRGTGKGGGGTGRGPAPGRPATPAPPPTSSAPDPTLVLRSGPGLGYPVAPLIPYTDPTGRLDPRFPAPGYTDPRRPDPGREPAAPNRDATGDLDRWSVWPTSSEQALRAPVSDPRPAAPGHDDAAQGEGDATPGPTDAQRLARERGIGADDERAAQLAARLGLVATIRHLLAIRTNTVLIVASALGYFYLAGIETFAVEFTKQQYGINQAVANLLLLVVGVGSVIGVLISGPLSDRMLRNGRLNSRIGTTTVLAAITVVLFIPALLTRSATTALPYVTFAALTLAAQNPPIDAARLDIVPAALWGRAEGLRTALRTAAQSLAPLVFGGISDLFGGHRSGLQFAFLLMLLPLAGNAYVLYRAMRTYPGDVATAAAAAAATAAVPARRGRSSAQGGAKRGAGEAAGGAAPSASPAPASPGWPQPADPRPATSWPQVNEPRPGPDWRQPSDENWNPGWPQADDEPRGWS